MTKITIEVPDEVAQDFEGKTSISYTDIIAYEESHWESIEVNDKATTVLDFLKGMKS